MFVEKTQRCLLNDILLRTQTVIENSWDAKDTYLFVNSFISFANPQQHEIDYFCGSVSDQSHQVLGRLLFPGRGEGFFLPLLNW